MFVIAFSGGEADDDEEMSDFSIFADFVTDFLQTEASLGRPQKKFK
jgi:hypothetical protein